MKKTLISAAQLLLGVGLVVFIITHLENRDKLLPTLRQAAGDLPTLVAGVMTLFGCLVLCTWRWRLLLKAQGTVVGFGRALALTFVGQFFSSFIIGATGGDVFKAVYVARDSEKGRKAENVLTIVLDRLIGLVALVVLSTAMMLLHMPFFLAHAETRWALAANGVILLAVVSGFVVVLAREKLERLALFRKVESSTRFGEMIARLYQATHICLRDPGLLAKTFLLSLANHLLFVCMSVAFGSVLGLGLTFGDYLMVFPIINSIAALPLTPGGVGIRDKAGIVLLGALGVAETASFSVTILMYATIVFWSLVGGIVYMWFISAARRGGSGSTSASTAVTGM